MKKILLFFIIACNVCNGYAQNAAQSDNFVPIALSPDAGGKQKCKIKIPAPKLVDLGFVSSVWKQGGVSIITLPKSSTDDQIIAAYRKILKNIWSIAPVKNPNNCELEYDKCADEYITTEQIEEFITWDGKKEGWRITITRKTLCPDALTVKAKIYVYFR